MRAGTLNRRITIEQLGSAEDSWGQHLPDVWVRVASVWASVRNLSGLSSIKAEAQTSTVRTSIRIRYRQDIEPGMRALLGSTIYKIEAVLPDESGRQYTDLVCEVTR